MNYLTDLTNEEIKYVCTVIPSKEISDYFRKYPKEFAKLRPGFRVKSLNEEIVIRTLYDFRNKDFIASFLIKHIDRWIKEIDEELEKVLETGLDYDRAYIDVLSRSFFSENVALFFKIKEEQKSEEYLRVLSAAVSCQKTQGEKLDSLANKQLDFNNIQDRLKNCISKEEKELEKFREREEKLKENLKEKEKQLEFEQEKSTHLLEETKALEIELEKIQEDEVWRTAQMQQKIESLTSKLENQMGKESKYESCIAEYITRLSSAEDDVKTWKNHTRNREKQIFSYKAERAALLAEKEEKQKRIKELEETLDKLICNEKFKQKEQRKVSEKVTSNVEWNMPLHPDDMDDFDEYFNYNLENIGFDSNENEASEFVDYFEKSIFCGIPILMKRGPGINLANCLANTLYGVPIAARLMYSENKNVKKISEFLASTTDRVVCIDGFIGNCNEMELIPVLEQHRNKIIIITYMYDKTLRFVPKEILSSIHFISADYYAQILKIRDITEDASEIKEVSFIYKSNAGKDSRSQKILYEIACECGLGIDIANSMADMIESEKHMNEMLMFTLLPYVSYVLEKNPYNCSKRLQKYAGEEGRCLKKDVLMRWFG